MNIMNRQSCPCNILMYQSFLQQRTLPDLLPSQMWELRGQQEEDGGERVAQRQQEADQGRQPAAQGQHAVGDEHREHDMPRALGARRASGGASSGYPGGAEGGPAQHDAPARPGEARVARGAGVHEGQQGGAASAMDRVIDILRSGRPGVGRAQGGQRAGDEGEQRQGCGDGGALQLEGVAPVEGLQLVVLEPLPVQQPTERAGPHRLYSVVHRATDRAPTTNTTFWNKTKRNFTKVFGRKNKSNGPRSPLYFYHSKFLR